MPEFPISDRALEDAREFVGKTFARIEHVSTVGEAFDANEGLREIASGYHFTWLGDVVNHVWGFALLRAASIEAKRDMPFVWLGEAGAVPILQNVTSNLTALPFVPPLSWMWLDIVEDWFASSHLKVGRVDPKSAFKIFGESLSRFLERRFDFRGPLGDGGGLNPPAGGLPTEITPNGNYLVKLTSRQPNWQALKSPAYAMDFTYFGAPTFPVWGYIPGGRWIFAGNPPASTQFVTDATVFVIPQTVTPTVTAF